MKEHGDRPLPLRIHLARISDVVVDAAELHEGRGEPSAHEREERAEEEPQDSGHASSHGRVRIWLASRVREGAVAFSSLQLPLNGRGGAPW